MSIYVKWIAYAAVVVALYGGARRAGWDPGSASVERDALPTGAAGRRSAYFVFWSTGFGGK
jgi:hypothetical protein